jgi:hypothetical protein
MSRTNDEATDRTIANVTAHARTPSLALALAVALALVGCAEPEAESEVSPTGPWVTWRSEYITYHTRPDDSLADESDVRAVESKLVELWDFLGVEPAARGAIEWYRFRDVSDWQARGSDVCPGASAGCSRGPVIFGPSRVFEHEVVHAALHGASAPPELLAEGLALALSCLPEEEDLLTETTPSDWRTVLRSEANIFGAKLVMRLLRESPSSFMRFYRSIDYEAGADELATAFRAVYDASLDDAWRLAQSDPNQYHCAPFWACRHPAPDQRDFELSRTRGGADSGLLLPSTATMLRITDGAGRIALRRCDGQDAEGFLPVVSTTDTWILPAQQQLAVHVLYEQPATLSVAALSADSSSRCDGALPFQVREVPSRKPLVMAAVDEPQFLNITTDVPSTLRIGDPLPLLRGEDGWFGDVCTRCENGTVLDCTMTGGAALQAPVWLRMTRDASAPAASLTVTLGFYR